MRLQHGCFPVNFAKTLTTPFFRTTLGVCFCIKFWREVCFIKVKYCATGKIGIIYQYSKILVTCVSKHVWKDSETRLITSFTNWIWVKMFYRSTCKEFLWKCLQPATLRKNSIQSQVFPCEIWKFFRIAVQKRIGQKFENTRRHGRSPVNLLHIFRKTFPKIIL